MNFSNWRRKGQSRETQFDDIMRAFNSPEGLASWLLRLTQEVQVLKKLLEEKGLWDEARYKRAMTEQMIGDHYSGGAFPQLAHSYYPYVLDQLSFLKHRFNATEAEVKAFKEEVDSVSCLT